MYWISKHLLQPKVGHWSKGFFFLNNLEIFFIFLSVHTHPVAVFPILSWSLSHSSKRQNKNGNRARCHCWGARVGRWSHRTCRVEALRRNVRREPAETRVGRCLLTITAKTGKWYAAPKSIKAARRYFSFPC